MTTMNPLDLNALKALTAAHERHQGAVSVLGTLEQAEQLSGQTVTLVSATWETELDFDRNEYEELNSLNVKFSEGLNISFHLCAVNITNLPPEAGEDNDELQDKLESEFGEMAVHNFTYDLLALNENKQRSFTMTGDELRALAIHVPTQAYVSG